MLRTEDFRFTSITDMYIDGSIVNTNSVYIQKILNSYLKIKNYGSALDYIFFAHIILTDCYNHPNKKIYSRKKKGLFIYLQLPWNKVPNTSKEELQELMAILYLESIKKYKSWHIKDFDSDRFYQDVRSVWLDNQIVRLSELEKAHEWVSIPI